VPCLSFLSQLREAEPQVRALGASVVAVATGAHHQAQHLMDTGMPYPCLVDPAKALYRELGIGRIPLSQWLRPATWRRYARTLGMARQGRITGDPLQAGGVAVIDTDGTLRYLHRSSTLADLPPLEEVLGAVADVVG
jgi:peroxiredoxin